MPGKPSQGRRNAPEASEYLRRDKPIRVRRGPLSWLLPATGWLLVAICMTGLWLASVRSLHYFLDSSLRFTWAADFSGLHVSGLQNVKPEAVLTVFRPDGGESVARVPLGQRYHALLGIPWVEEAYVRRVWPNEIHVHVEERTPVAFVRVTGDQDGTETPKLIDAAGVFLDLPPGADYSLPVISGVTPAMALPERRLRLAVLDKLIRELDSAEPRYSTSLSEIDLSDPRNPLGTAVHEQQTIELQLGDKHFRHRFEIFLTYIGTWKEEYGVIRSVDLRFEGQVAVQRAER